MFEIRSLGIGMCVMSMLSFILAFHPNSLAIIFLCVTLVNAVTGFLFAYPLARQKFVLWYHQFIQAHVVILALGLAFILVDVSVGVFGGYLIIYLVSTICMMSYLLKLGLDRIVL